MYKPVNKNNYFRLLFMIALVVSSLETNLINSWFRWVEIRGVLFLFRKIKNSNLSLKLSCGLFLKISSLLVQCISRSDKKKPICIKSADAFGWRQRLLFFFYKIYQKLLLPQSRFRSYLLLRILKLYRANGDFQQF